MEVGLKLTLKDYQEFNKAIAVKVLKKNKIIKGLLIYSGIMLILWVILALTKIGSSMSNKQETEVAFFSPGLTAFIIFIIVVIIAVILVMKRSSKKYFESNTLMQAKIKYLITEEGIGVSSENGNTNITWGKVYKIEFYKTGYAVFISTKQAVIIPKRVLSYENQLNQLEDIFIRHVPEEKIIR